MFKWFELYSHVGCPWSLSQVGGGVLLGIPCWGCAARFFKSWSYFRPKNVISHTCRPLKTISVFRHGLYAEIMSLSLLRLERKQKNSSNPFRIRILLFLSYSFAIETMNTFIHSCNSLKNYIRLQTKMGKVYTRFQTKMGKVYTRSDQNGQSVYPSSDQTGKVYSRSDQNGQSVYPFSDQNGAKTLPDGAAHTYIAYVRDYPFPRGLCQCPLNLSIFQMSFYIWDR